MQMDLWGGLNGGGLLDGLFRRRGTMESPQSSAIQSIFHCLHICVIAFAICHNVIEAQRRKLHNPKLASERLPETSLAATKIGHHHDDE